MNEELLIVNNLVRMIRQKVYDNKLSMDYPHSMNFVDTIQYIDECRNHRELLIDKVYIDREKFRVAYTAILNTQASESNQEAREINGGESCLEIPLQTISRNVSNGPQVGEEKHTLGNEQRENGQMPHRQVANLQTRQIDTVQMMQIDNMQMRQVDNPGSHYPVNGGQLQQIFGGQPQPQSINLGQAPHRYPPILQEHVGRPEYP